MPVIRRIDLADERTLDTVLELQRASYAVEAALIGFRDIPPLLETREALKTCGETFYGAFSGETLTGFISYRVDVDVLDIHRVAVHPAFFRKGIADALVKSVENREAGIRTIMVCTGKDNTPAVRLYLKNGYGEKEDIRIGDRLLLTAFEKHLRS